MRAFLFQHRWKFIFAAPLMSILIIYGLMALSLKIFINYYIEPKFAYIQNEFAHALPQIIADAKMVNAAPPFPEFPRQKNAEAYLSKHLHWSGDDTKQNAGSQKLADLFGSKFKNWRDRKDIQKQILDDPKIWKNYQTSWLEGLHRFDHFDPTTNSKVQNQLTKLTDLSGIDRMGVVATLPVIDYAELRNLALAHVFKNASNGQTVKSLKTFRKVAQLIHSSHSLIGNMIATAMLKDEPYLQKILGAQEWVPVPLKTVQAYHRLSSSMGIISKAPWIIDIPNELAVLVNPQTGLCAGVTESVSGPLVLQEFLEPHLPLEPDFRETLSQLRKSHENFFKVCGLEAYSALLSPPAKIAVPWFLTENHRVFSRFRSPHRSPAEETSISAEFNTAKIPFVRKAVGLILSVIAMPNYFKLYNEKPADK